MISLREQIWNHDLNKLPSLPFMIMMLLLQVLALEIWIAGLSLARRVSSRKCPVTRMLLKRALTVI